MTQRYVRLKGCRQNNLTGFNLSLPKDTLVVITGVSGSGKSSLAFDTLYAEGQRRFLEYLSPQARQLMRQMPRPDIDFIEGLSPTLAVQQNRRGVPSRTTVAAHTDIQDFLALLLSRVGRQHSPVTGQLLRRYTRQEMVEAILQHYAVGARLQLLAPVSLEHESFSEAVDRLQKSGFLRLKLDGQEFEIDQQRLDVDVGESPRLEVVVDRLVMKEDLRERLSASLETALDLSGGILKVCEGRDGPVAYYTEIFLCADSGMRFDPLVPADFNPKSPRGACPQCFGCGYLHDDVDQICSLCQGARLKSVSLACRVGGDNIAELCALSIEELSVVAKSWTFTGRDAVVAGEIIPEIVSRLEFLSDVGLGYLELNRLGSTLSEGEAQRVQLASQLGAKLSGILYILDEPSRGLHRRDLSSLVHVLSELQRLGNSVVIVEHDAQMIACADHVVELGPGSGVHGGKIVFQGSLQELRDSPTSVTGHWLQGKEKLPKQKARKMGGQQLEIVDADTHNLKNLTLQIPLGGLVGVCGVSGSGKSTLAVDVLSQELKQHLKSGTPCPHINNPELIERLVIVEQRPSGISARSTPATYVGLMTPLRSLYAKTRLARARGYTASRFSTNRKGGRCEACEGLGLSRVDMQFMPELYVTCDLCRGRRYNYETLQVLWEELSIADTLDLSVSSAVERFQHHRELVGKLSLMQELGLGYLTLGQSFSTLSGGEIQRLKLVAELARTSAVSTLYILDEPCVGLHFSDVAKLIAVLQRLVDAGNSAIVVEHNIALLQQCDWLVELGPNGGPYGGELVFEGTQTKFRKASTATSEVLKFV